MKKGIKIRKLLVILFLVVFTIFSYISIRGSYLEYKELGEKYLTTFLTKQKIKYSVMSINFIAIYLIVYMAGRKIKKGLKLFFKQENKELPKLPNKSLALVIAIVESIFIMKIFTSNIILCISNMGFGETDPVFNLDISFFMFIEPLLKTSIIYFIGIFVGLTLYAFAYYTIVFNHYFDGIDKDTLLKSPAMKTLYKNIKFIAIGLTAYSLICSMDIVYDNFLTTDNNIKIIGASFTDVTIKFWGYNIFAIVLLIAIFRAVRNLKLGNQTKILKDLAIVPIYLIGLFIIMILFDFTIVRPNEFDKEKINIQNNISATKKAYNINCDIENINYTGTISVEEVENNKSIVDNTIIINNESVLDNLKNTQSRTGYYTYRTAKLSTYLIDGIKKVVYASPREIINNRRTYNSKTYEYTHGYGIIFTSATSVNENGEIEYIQNDISGKEEKINIATPQIYYGLETNTTVVTKAKGKKEFDYADNEKEYETDYKGKSGLSLNFLDRLILGIKQKNINLAFSTSVDSNSKVLINRNIIERAKLALPDVIYDENPYTVVDKKGDIYWILDAYTISSSYPFSTYTEIFYNGQKRGINYIRNSIKVIINAYTGEMKYYITDRTDPIVMAYRKIYPEVFENLDSTIPEDISANFTYPEFLYKVQATMLEEYHNTKADVLYRSDDTWEKATYKNSQNNGKSRNSMNPYYTMVKNEDGDELLGLIQMYTQKDKQSIRAYLVGTVEKGENKLYLKSMSSNSSILGPTQLDTQILQDEIIQKEINELNVTGAKITKNMIIVPIENTLLYIEPIYQTLINETNRPVLKKVIVASGNKVAIGNNLTTAIENLISQYATNIEIQSTEDIDGLIDSIIKANDNLSESLERNDWDLMGTDIKKLQELIESLKQQVKEEKEEKNKLDQNTENTLNNTIDLKTNTIE